jgi:flagellar basal-body rod modification protein FlgD
VHLVSANYTLPTVLGTLRPPANVSARNAASTRATTGTSSTTSSSSSAASSIGSTFLSLLSTELQNQDPTAPVDSTAMVGQMISLNQLDQLISINQTLGGTNTSTTGLVQKPAAASDTAANSANGGLAHTLPATVAGAAAAATSMLPFDPNTLMPLGYGNPGAMGASINSSINPATMNFSPANNNTSGGK